MNVYLLYEGDGTSMAAPNIVGATLNAEKAEQWRDEVSLGSWEYRSIKRMSLRWTENEEES